MHPGGADTLAQATFWIAVATLVAAVAANLIARGHIRVALRDFELNQKQFKEQLKAPVLTLQVLGHKTLGGAVPLPIAGDGRTLLGITTLIQNRGDKAVSRFRAEFLVPYYSHNRLAEDEIKIHEQQFGLTFAGLITLLGVGEGNFRRYIIDCEEPIFAGDSVTNIML